MIKISELKISEDEVQAVANVLLSGNLREGEKCFEFERHFAEIVGAQYATTVSSGTAALHAAYLNLINSGDEVLAPAITFFATASMIDWAGGIPVFCDIDPKTFCIDLNDAENKITSRTRAIAPVHLFGNACDIDGIKTLANKYDLKIIWDAAQAHLTEYKNKDIGSFGDAVCYSFYATKNMTTGEGGMITSNDRQFIEKCVRLKRQGQEKKYYHTVMGTNYRMTDMQAALGIEQLKKLHENTQKRRQNASLLDKGLQSIDGIITPYVSPEVKHCYHQYTILLADSIGTERDRVISQLKERGVGCGINYPTPLHLQPVFQKYKNHNSFSLNCAENYVQRCLSLPVHPYLKADDIQFIIEAVKEVVGGL